MDDLNAYMNFLMEIFNNEMYYSPKVIDSNKIALLYSNGGSKSQGLYDKSDSVITTITLEKVMDSGKYLPGVHINASSSVVVSVSRDRHLSLAITCTTLNNEYKNRNLKFDIFEINNTLGLSCDINAMIQPNDPAYAITGCLNELFRITLSIRSRMSNGVLIY